jgi:hypothetical protein
MKRGADKRKRKQREQRDEQEKLLRAENIKKRQKAGKVADKKKTRRL